MRRFDEQEMAWLERLALVARSGPLPAAAFLERVHFSRASARGMVLQPLGRFGYCYVRPAHLATAGAAQAERRSLLALLLLLAWLRREHYVALEREDERAPTSLIVVGEAFDAVRADRSRLVLSQRGEYSCDPQQVLEPDGSVAYEGIRLEGDAYSLAADWALGTLHASPALETLWADARAAQEAGAASLAAARAEAACMAPIGADGGSKRERLLRSAKTFFGRRRAPAGAARAVVRIHAVSWLLGVLSGTLAGAHVGGSADRPPARSSARHDAPTAAMPSAGDPWTTAQPRLVALDLPAPAAPIDPSCTGVDATGGPASPGGAAPIVQGLDVSKWNGNWVDHLAGPLSGIHFVFARASDGMTADPAFARHWSAARRNGLIRGSYHFYRVGLDPVAQAQFYVRTIARPAPTERDIAPVLDFEDESFPPGARPPREKVQADFLRSLQSLELWAGRVPMIYTNWEAGTNWLDDPRFARYPLWIADWSARASPRLPATWALQGFRFWQRTDHYRRPDPDRPATDLDCFVGTPADLVR